MPAAAAPLLAPSDAAAAEPGEPDSASGARGMPAAAAPLLAPGGAAKEAESRKAAMSDILAKRREALQKAREVKQVQQAAEQACVEKWSGLRIAERCVRQEKLDICMKGKQLVKISKLSALTASGKDQVVIGVLCAPLITRLSPGGEKIAELVLTDLDHKSAQTAKLVLTGRAVDHWADAEGAGRRHCTVGSLLAVLNPSPLKQAGGGMFVAVETQLLKLGVCPSLRICSVKDKQGLPCRRPYSSEGGDAMCSMHASMSHSDRQAEMTLPSPGQHRRVGEKRKFVPMPTSSEMRKIRLLSEQARQQQRCPKSSGSATASISEAVEQAGMRLAIAADALGARGVRLLLDQLEELEKSAFAPHEIKGSPLYEQVGALVQRPDAAGLAAKRLRRSWRLLAEGAAG